MSTRADAAAENLELLLSIKATLFDAIRGEDYPVDQVPPLCRRLQEILQEITDYDYDDKAGALRTQRDILLELKAILKSHIASPDTHVKYLAALTGRLQLVTKELAAIDEKLRQGKGRNGGRSASAKFDRGSI